MRFLSITLASLFLAIPNSGYAQSIYDPPAPGFKKIFFTIQYNVDPSMVIVDGLTWIYYESSEYTGYAMATGEMITCQNGTVVQTGYFYPAVSYDEIPQGDC